jgi:syntaxin 6
LPWQDNDISDLDVKIRENRKQLKRQLKRAVATLQDVSMTVELIVSDRERFTHLISPQELSSRQQFVTSSQQRLHRIQQDVTMIQNMIAPTVTEQSRDDNRPGSSSAGSLSNGSSGALPLTPSNHQQHPSDRLTTNASSGGFWATPKTRNGSASTSLLSSDSENGREGDAAFHDSQARTSLLLQKQDETLDVLGEAVIRVGYMADNIHDEINQQNKMLTEMDADLTNAEQELGVVMGKLGKFLQTKDKWQLGTVLAMSLTVVILFFLVLYT